MQVSHSNASPQTSRAKVLIVEDEGLVALAIERQLRDLGYVITGLCASGQDAIRSVRENPPDLIVMDIRIQGEFDGVELSKLLHQKYDIPVIFLTAFSDSTTLARVREAGPFAYLLKPFHGASLAVAAEIALHKHRSERALRSRREWVESILGNLASGVIVTDHAGIIQFLNPVAERLTGWPAREALNQPFHVVLPIRDLTASVEVDDLIPHALHTGRTAVIPGGLHAVSRKTFAIDGEIAPHLDCAIIRGCVITFRDISDRLEGDEAIAVSIPQNVGCLLLTDEETGPLGHLKFVN